jgi:hypothetical protein
MLQSEDADCSSMMTDSAGKYVVEWQRTANKHQASQQLSLMKLPFKYRNGGARTDIKKMLALGLPNGILPPS